MLQRACNDLTLKAWLSSDLDGATMDTLAVQGVLNLLYALGDDVSRVRGMPMPSRIPLWTSISVLGRRGLAGFLVACSVAVLEGCGCRMYSLPGSYYTP